jgi:hypothetical protein
MRGTGGDHGTEGNDFYARARSPTTSARIRCALETDQG